MYRDSDDEDNESGAIHRVSSRPAAVAARLRRRRSADVLARRNNNNNNDNFSDDSGSVISLHRDHLHRPGNMLTWRDPALANRLPNADRNNNNGKLNPLKSSGFRWLHFEVFTANQI